MSIYKSSTLYAHNGVHVLRSASMSNILTSCRRPSQLSFYTDTRWCGANPRLGKSSQACAIRDTYCSHVLPLSASM